MKLPPNFNNLLQFAYILFVIFLAKTPSVGKLQMSRWWHVVIKVSRLAAGGLIMQLSQL
jgi:hypothetical protein